MRQVIDLTPAMREVLATIGDRCVTAHEIAANSTVMVRLYDLGFVKIDMPREGRMPAYYSLSERGIGAAAVLTAKPNPGDYETPISRIKRLVAAHYRIPAIEMVSARRARVSARPRQVAMFLARNLTPHSLPEIGRRFGNRDHTTVLHAVRLIERLKDEDIRLKDDIKTLEKEFISGSAIYAGDKPAFFVASRMLEAA